MKYSFLYISRTGLLEPLGQSQVLSYLKPISSKFSISILSVERSEDLKDLRRVAQLESECQELGIVWRRIRYFNGFKYLGVILNTIELIFRSMLIVRQQKVDFLHVRSYVPAFVGYTVRKFFGTPYIFDMRGLWIEELITSGRLQRGSALHRSILACERMCLRDASAVVHLTHSADAYIKKIYSRELDGKTVVIIPTCADLDRFKEEDLERDAQIHGCIGSVLSGWFEISWLSRWFATIHDRYPKARFEVITRDDAATVLRELKINGNQKKVTKIFRSLPEDMHQHIAKHTSSALFYSSGSLSELGRCPTRMAEVLGSGVPIIASSGIGDMDSILKKHAVGVIVMENSEKAMSEALDELTILLEDPDLSTRCRRVAEDEFSLAKGVELYTELYQSVCLSRQQG